MNDVSIKCVDAKHGAKSCFYRKLVCIIKSIDAKLGAKGCFYRRLVRWVVSKGRHCC